MIQLPIKRKTRLYIGVNKLSICLPLALQYEVKEDRDWDNAGEDIEHYTIGFLMWYVKVCVWPADQLSA